MDKLMKYRSPRTLRHLLWAIIRFSFSFRYCQIFSTNTKTNFILFVRQMALANKQSENGITKELRQRKIFLYFIPFPHLFDQRKNNTQCPSRRMWNVSMEKHVHAFIPDWLRRSRIFHFCALEFSNLQIKCQNLFVKSVNKFNPGGASGCFGVHVRSIRLFILSVIKNAF